jgi:S1-C subfamily serine protease
VSKNNSLSPKLFFIVIMVYILIFPFQLSCKSMSLSQITQGINPRVVQIVFVAQQTEGELTSDITPIGTGFLVNNDGYIITANHLIDLGEQYMQQTQAETKKLGITIPPPPNAINNPPVLQTPTNDFDVIARDNEHDLALLKVKMSTVISPLNGETLHGVIYSNDMGGSLFVGDAHFTKNISQNLSIAITGYPSNQMVPETKTGKVTSKEITSVINSRISLASGYVTYNVTDYFQTDITSNQVLSGSPVYSTKNGKIMGVCINVVQNESDSSVITAIIPSRYVLDLLESNNTR